MAAIADKDRKCRSIGRMIAEGRGVTESCRVFGISEKTYYRWRNEQAAAGSK
ncbi:MULTISPECIES: helix-turn-helix domain-containing protein [Erythrobacteraceae]|uniref:helix-turn-helix domain-containing protein n=1 Tax=Erythrobacteraceae TaxID=335929 RepID=UPI000A3F84A1|nr:helix-turn-helix domain-containing protein [Erythrobacter sp. SG61-1L]